MKQTLEEAAKSMAYDKMPDWGGLPMVAKNILLKAPNGSLSNHLG